MERFSSPVWWLMPALGLTLGALLGAVNLSSPEANGGLRVPALLAALILVAHGMVDLENRRRTRKADEAAEDGQATADTGSSSTPPGQSVVLHADEVVIHETRLPGNVAVEQAQAQALEQRRVAGTAVRENRGTAIAVLLLAVWLGLATLNYTGSPPTLLWLSLVSAFLLFASAWNLLQPSTSTPGPS